MAFERWRGGVDTFSNPAAWSPATVPQPGDTAVITAGTLTDTSATGTTYVSPSTGLTLFAIAQAGAPPPVIAPTFWTFSGSTIVLDNRADTAIMTFDGGKYFGNAGTMEFVGGRFQLSHSGTPSGTFANSGTMSLVDADITAAAAPFYEIANDGRITLAGTTRLTGIVGGTGTTIIEPDAVVTLSSAVANTQTVQFAGTSSAAILTLSQPSAFAATLTDFAAGDTVLLSGLTSGYTATYMPTATNAGTLALTSAGQPGITLNFTGTYVTADFTLSSNTRGLAITTTRTDTRAPDPTGHDGHQVYRFFDTRDGTHFYTPSIAERDDIPATRSDMVYEGAVFADVATTDPAAAPVYRFFDIGNGTHFFTASQAERDQLGATRPDLTAEGIGFYVHRTAQPGDTPVARFFSTTDGSHLYVENPTEAATIASTRPDLTNEGTAFYVPKT